jgi:hypothetical protein
LQEQWAQYDVERYRRLRAECVEIADKIIDEYYRAVVINYLVEVCMKACGEFYLAGEFEKGDRCEADPRPIHQLSSSKS